MYKYVTSVALKTFAILFKLRVTVEWNPRRNSSPKSKLISQVIFCNVESGKKWFSRGKRDNTCEPRVIFIIILNLYPDVQFRSDIAENPDSFRCPEYNRFLTIVNFLYIFIANILLLNLLIAMFTYSFDRVQKDRF